MVTREFVFVFVFCCWCLEAPKANPIVASMRFVQPTNVFEMFRGELDRESPSLPKLKQILQYFNARITKTFSFLLRIYKKILRQNLAKLPLKTKISVFFELRSLQTTVSFLVKTNVAIRKNAFRESTFVQMTVRCKRQYEFK